MSMFSQFQTSKDLETKGVIINYGDFRVLLARAGGANKRFARVMEYKTKPYRRAIQTDTMDNERGMELLRETYAETVILDWEVRVVADDKGKALKPYQHAGHQENEPEHTTWVRGIENQEGGVDDFNADNVAKALKTLPDLFTDFQEQAGKAALYREETREEDAGN